MSLSPAGKVAFHVPGGEGELNPAMRDKNGNSYSSTYYYYEVSPRDGEDVDDEEEDDDSHGGRRPYDTAVVDQGYAKVKQFNLTFVFSKEFVV